MFWPYCIYGSYIKVEIVHCKLKWQPNYHWSLYNLPSALKDMLLRMD